jgi:hypothetical protein
VHGVQDHPPPGTGSQQAAGQLRGTAGHHVPVAQHVYARETARVDDPFRRVDLIAQCPARAGGHGRSRTGGGHERIAEGRPDGNADALNLARLPQGECAGRDRQPGRGRAGARTVCLCGPGWESAGEFSQVVAHCRDGRGAGDLPVGGVLVEGLDEPLVLLLVMLAAGVGKQRLQVAEQVRYRPACGVRFPACTPASMSRTRVPAAAAIAGTAGVLGLVTAAAWGVLAWPEPSRRRVSALYGRGTL